MAKVGVFSTLSNIRSVSEFMRFASTLMTKLTTEFNGQIDFVENIRAAGPYEIEFPDSSTVKTIEHNLGRLPDGFLVIDRDASAVIYRPSDARYEFTDKKIFLKASAAATATIYVI